MSCKDVQELPAKKRRRVMEAPEGFERHKPANVAKTNVQVPKFTSAFAGNAQPVQQKPPSKSKMDIRPLFVSKPGPQPSISKPTSKPNLKQLPVPSFPVPSKEKEKEKNSVQTFRIPPPPDPRFATKGESSLTTALHPPLRPPPRPPPVPNVAPARSGVPLKNLSLPTIFSPADSTLDKSMRTISTTEIALATDISTDSGAAELAHIFLHDQHPEIAASSNEEPTEWNLGMSPQKGAKFVKGKGKEAKFVKGGLAARASELAARSHTSLVLWHKETELQLTSSSSHRLTPDLRLRIVKILDSPAGAKPRSPRKPSFSASTAISPGVAICRVVSTPSSKHPHFSHVSPRTREKQQHLVVLSFPTTAPSRLNRRREINVRNPEDFIVGREVCVWEPWLEIPLSPQSSSNDDGLWSMKADPELLELTAAPFPTLPSTYSRPSPPPEGMENGDVRTAETVLLCSRFVIVP